METGSLVPARIDNVEAFPLRAPVAVPVKNSFRTLRERESVLVRVTDADGATGWGEIWSAYPPKSAGHRANLLREVVAPMIVGKSFSNPISIFQDLERATRVPALQCGEPGPFAQVVAGIDMALWDLQARRAGMPLWRMLGGVPFVRVYGSGLGPDQPERLAARRVEEGYDAVKVKVGFGREIDTRNLRAVREVLGEGRTLMLDANQRWNVAEAIASASALADFAPLWLEEPIAADEPMSTWRDLARRSPVPLAAGENLRGEDAFGALIDSRVVGFIQPDLGKWGGVSGSWAVARLALAADVTFCPHWLGGGIGLLASLHMLGTARGRGWGEVDANPNPLRERFLPESFRVANGTATLPDEPGLGYTPDADALQHYAIA